MDHQNGCGGGILFGALRGTQNDAAVTGVRRVFEEMRDIAGAHLLICEQGIS